MTGVSPPLQAARILSVFILLCFCLNHLNPNIRCQTYQTSKESKQVSLPGPGDDPIFWRSAGCLGAGDSGVTRDMFCCPNVHGMCTASCREGGQTQTEAFQAAHRIGHCRAGSSDCSSFGQGDLADEGWMWRRRPQVFEGDVLFCTIRGHRPAFPSLSMPEPPLRYSGLGN